MIRTPLSPYQRDIWVAAAQFPENNQYTLFCYDRLIGGELLAGSVLKALCCGF
ncbi:hypothetical protein [Pseudomonas sp. B21-048]|uniref:hypothetical protein n=1 Tax=Pseudomonas sp. B21-048 TaxID=2895490 RepID=UPI00215E4AE7|nr:hypothetical protein [Pseudomonas sp. B21-048]UVK96808.1 hypothetical protein LOY56_15575 [Pseudomonas sp. B21-048]